MTDRDYAVRQYLEDMTQAADMLRMQLDAGNQSGFSYRVLGLVTQETLTAYVHTVLSIYRAYAAKRSNIVYVYQRGDDGPPASISP